MAAERAVVAEVLPEGPRRRDGAIVTNALHVQRYGAACLIYTMIIVDVVGVLWRWRATHNQSHMY